MISELATTKKAFLFKRNCWLCLWLPTLELPSRHSHWHGCGWPRLDLWRRRWRWSFLLSLRCLQNALQHFWTCFLWRCLCLGRPAKFKGHTQTRRAFHSNREATDERQIGCWHWKITHHLHNTSHIHKNNCKQNIHNADLNN